MFSAKSILYYALIASSFLSTTEGRPSVTQRSDTSVLNARGTTGLKESTTFCDWPTAEELIPALITSLSTAFFWSGRTGSTSAQPTSVDLAREAGGLTLEMALSVAGLTMPRDRSDPRGVQLWVNASNIFARQATGDVTVVLGQDVRPEGVWTTSELPLLMSNQAVSTITAVDMTTGNRTVIFDRNPAPAPAPSPEPTPGGDEEGGGSDGELRRRYILNARRSPTHVLTMRQEDCQPASLEAAADLAPPDGTGCASFPDRCDAD